ncbi:hypothetical protein FNO01nite_05220 [Flavobacterium noncentrifugens]|uniref:Oxygen sensor histidine kinase NreB n=1 Tax=Flavobacterium noncentrifugens TaxID=1128970 RepID=A0A1G8SIU2_9FLAO|nr:sensor histidine kinase [Flavobacterium noncentrifugens]GEP49850.1 hypothetical protein FNO01nite_05220 [Flavobacterium noncentrifugens]SDJ29156.1 Signal transduction histidine kinase [Flavobacterium noncentrifugens]
MKKLSLIIFVCIACACLGCSKSKKTVSAEAVRDSVSIYINLFKGGNSSQNQKIKYNQRAYELLQTRKIDSSSLSLLNTIADNFDLLGRHKQFRKLSQELLERSVAEKDTVNISKAYKNLGKYHIDSNQNDSSFYYYLKAEKFNRYIGDSLSLGEIYLDMAFIQLYESDFNGSETSASKALPYLNKSSNKKKIYEAYNLIGINSNQLKNFDKALEYHTKALNYIENTSVIDKNFLMASSLNNIGYVYQTIGEQQKAIENFNIALKDISLQKGNPTVYAMLIDNLAYSKFKINDFSQLPGLFYKSLKLRDSLKQDNSGIILNKIHLSELFAAKKDTIIAQKYAREALDFSRKTRVSSDILASLQQLSSIEHKNAIAYSKEYIKISDSLQQAERKAKDKFARIAFETDEIISQKDKLAEQNRSISYFFVGTLFIGILLFVIRSQRAKNRELLLREAQQKANEDIYNLMISQQANIEESRVKEKKRIAQELHDGVLGRLFGARLNLDSLNRATDEQSVESRFNYLAELKNIEQDIREISHDLNREKYVVINNFVAIVNNLLEEQHNSHDAQVFNVIENDINWEKVNNTVKINLYRILQESLQNVNKYAKAQNVKVEISKENDNIVLKISDDGAGFQTQTRKKGIGLQNMQSRVDECKGSFTIASKPGSGTKIVVTVPMISDMTIVT